MPDERTELEKRNFLRLSNEEANKLTKECIQTALIHLMAEEDIDAISISRIVKKAGVSRTAFYNNYSSKEDVLREVSSSLLEKIDRMAVEAMAEDRRTEVFTKLFQAVKEDPRQFEMLLRSGIYDSEYTNINVYVSERYPKLDAKIRRLVFALGGMVMSMLLDWFAQGMREDVPEMAELCAQLTEDILARIRSVDPGFAK